MGTYIYLRQLWKKPTDELKIILRQRLNQFRDEPVTIRIEHPTRLDRARSLGYKAKPGFIIIRQSVMRHKRQMPKTRHPRRPKHSSVRKDLAMSYQWVAEQRAVKKYPNCEVLNSYFVAKDGMHYWYEVILVDRAHPQIAADDRIKWIINQRGRVFRGLTAAGKRSRGLLTNKGKGAEKMRPSLRAHGRRAH